MYAGLLIRYENVCHVPYDDNADDDDDVDANDDDDNDDGASDVSTTNLRNVARNEGARPKIDTRNK